MQRDQCSTILGAAVLERRKLAIRRHASRRMACSRRHPVGVQKLTLDLERLQRVVGNALLVVGVVLQDVEELFAANAQTRASARVRSLGQGHVRDAEDSGKLAKGLALLDEKVRPLGFVAVILFHTPRHHYEDVANNVVLVEKDFFRRELLDARDVADRVHEAIRASVKHRRVLENLFVEKRRYLCFQTQVDVPECLALSADSRVP
mmetsp:Transcript_55159/g.129096  ORF Transcript_55159/g.129096 Transcript_55159/m.129096 type:complete len:206 (-) Transcript_55159:94-711(-)